MWLGVYLLYCVLQESSGCTVERGVEEPITRPVGDTVVLPCACKGPGLVDPQTVQWGYRKKFVGGVYTAEHSVVSKDGSVNQRYRDRVERPNENPPGQVSLIISHLTEEDEGTYVCGNRDYNRAITLYVGGCSMLAQSYTLTRSPGESVLLPCPCPSTGHVKPERVTWSYSKAGSSDRTPVSNDAGSYRGRVRTFDQTGSRNLSLLISDLTKEDAGDYTCTSNQHSSRVELKVKGCALVENKQAGTVSRSSGESVLLSCTCTDPQDTPVTVQWRGPHQEDLLQRSRVQTFTKTSPGNLSVLISDLTVEDGGTYSCWINQNQYRTFTLTVKGCTLSQTQEEPITRYPEQSVLLPCSCTDPNTRPGSVKWERVDPGGTEVSNKTGLYSGRLQMFNKIHPSNLSLLISNLTEQDQGTYRCSINNKQSINIRLSITGCTVERGKGPDITGSVGDTVVLPCSCEKNKPVDPQAVQWGYRKELTPGVYTADHSVVSKDGSLNQRYRDRVQRSDQNPPGQVSLIISPLTEEDEGTYVCGNRDYNRGITLYVGGCSMVGLSHTLTRSPGESVLLPCPCPSTGHVKPERVTWSYSKAGSSDRTPVSNDSGSYRRRVRTFDQTGSRNLSLLISDLTKEDTGDYTCKSDQHTSKVVLQVKGCALVENKQTGTVSRSSGESVLLSCTCTDPPEDTPVTVQWRGPHQEDLLQRSRVQTFTETSPGNLSVLISDLTVEDGGTYSCWINQNQYRTFTLTVKAGQQGDQTAEQGNWAIIIIIGALIPILLLLGGGAACTYRKHVQGRKQRKDKDTGQRTNQADNDYENDPQNISMGPVYQSLNPKTNQSDSLYQSLDPKTT